MNALMTGHQVKVLLYNSQTVSPITDADPERGRQGRDPRDRRQRDAAAGATFQEWQLGQARELYAALAR